MVWNQLIDSSAAWIMEGMLSAMGDPPIRVVLWDGREYGAPEERAIGRVHIRDRGALGRLALDLAYEAGELYAEGRVDFDGDMIELLVTMFRGQIDTGLLVKLLPQRLVRGVLRYDLSTSRRNAQHHYDVGNEFYGLWLDERMVYTCAYFPNPQHTLEEAQLAKMDQVSRKLALRPGQHVIEAGCGWGSLALHMARYYGVTVRACNISSEQIAYAREQAEKQGLQERVEFIEDDYRNLSGRCDAFVSVGMLEHVGRSHYAELGRVVDRCLEPEGLGFVHTIGRSRPQRVNPWIERRIFPNAYPPTLREMMDVVEEQNFAVLDVENLRRHYRRTTWHWFQRFQQHRPRIEEMVGPHRTRSWELYLAGATAAFATGSLQLFQMLFSRASNDRIPWTRAHVGSGEPADFGEDAE
jgi:cyclopropane-fatty-acyl-phospholipid synthase